MMLGTVLGGRYRLDAQIGRGGMSTVYRAFDTVLERPVAIKLMHREIASDSDQLERFRREARSVARLSHPHIVTVIDAGEEPSSESEAGAGGVGTPYIVLEYVEGETLKALIRREGPLEIPRAIAYAIELTRALGAAHERLIVHRDVKPQNVLIGVEGSAKITDFGIARTLTEEALTMDGRVLGTTDYVSPEQALGQSVTGQSDLYSLGVVFYEMLTGSVPFSGETPVSVAMKHVRENVPDVQLARPEVSAATASVIDRATAKDVTQRYPDAASMLADLEEVLAIEASRTGQATGEVTTVLRTLPGSTRRRLPWRMRHPVRWVLSLALLGALVALVLVLLANHTHRGLAPDAEPRARADGGAPCANGRPRLQPVRYRPGKPRKGPERRSTVTRTPAWSTEQYYDGTLKKSGGTGVGLYVDAAPNVVGKQIEIQTPTPGFAAQIYLANHIDLSLPYGNSTPLAARGWQGPVAEDSNVRDGARIKITPSGGRYRYYLVWITTLPAGMQSASLSEVTLFR